MKVTRVDLPNFLKHIFASASFGQIPDILGKFKKVRNATAY